MQPCRILFWGKLCRDKWGSFFFFFSIFTSWSWCSSLVLTWSQSWMSCWLVVNTTNTRTELAYSGRWTSNRSSDGRNMDFIYGAWSDVKPLFFFFFYLHRELNQTASTKSKSQSSRRSLGAAFVWTMMKGTRENRLSLQIIEQCI